MKRYPKLNLSPADIAGAEQLREALLQVAELPDASQWEMALELLPDSLLLDVVRSNQRGDDMLNLVGTMAAVAVHTLTGERADEQTLAASIYGVIFACAGELEKRYKVFSENVVMMEYPYDYDPLEPVLFVPRDPENFSVEEVFEYYRSHDPAQSVLAQTENVA